MKVAIVHDWLTGMRGGERVLEIFCKIFPNAHLFTLFHFPNQVSEIIESHPIITSYLQMLPFKEKFYRNYLPLFPNAIESFDLEEYDLLVSTSHAVAKGAQPGKGAISVCYCHTPMRYIWDLYSDYFDNEGTSVAARLLMPFLHGYLKDWDLYSNSRVNHFIANSSFVADRISQFYNRTAVVVNPPVDTQFFAPDYEPPDDYFLIVSALVPYKRLDIAIQAFNQSGRNLIIIGKGPHESHLKRISNSNITFRGFLTDSEVRKYYQRCRALVFPGVEDFGLTPVETQACGRPVIAYASGGVLESVIQGVSGHFFHEQTIDSINRAINHFENMDFDPETIRCRALEYDNHIMRKKLNKYFVNLFKMYDWPVPSESDFTC